MVIWYMTAKIQQPVRDGDEPRAACHVHENEITWSGLLNLTRRLDSWIIERKCSQYRSFGGFFLMRALTLFHTLLPSRAHA